MRKKTAAEEAPPAPSFEQRLEELEALTARLESPDTPLEQALELFERGMLISEECRKMLTEAEAKVEILLQRGEAAEPVPFDPEQEA